MYRRGCNIKPPLPNHLHVGQILSNPLLIPASPVRAVARWPGGQGGGGQLPPQRALKRGRQNDDRGAPAAMQITRNVFIKKDDYLCVV